MDTLNVVVEDNIKNGYQQEAPLSFDLSLLNVLEMESIRIQITPETLSYLQELINRDDNLQYFHLAIEIIQKTEKIWLLKEKSLEFFLELKGREMTFQQTLISSTPFSNLLTKIRKLCIKSEIYLKSHHIDAVIDMLRKQQALPANLKEIVEQSSLGKRSSEIVRNLRKIHLPDIDKQAKKVDLIHHTIKHALEIQIRSMRVAKIIGLFESQTPLNQFLRPIIRFIIECHDLKQKDAGVYDTVEIASAVQVAIWLNESLGTSPDLQLFIEFLAGKIIVLGTTMIFSKVCALDLSQLSDIFEEATLSANICMNESTNKEFINEINAMMLITGVCDKTPAAFYEVVKAQASQEKTNSLHNLKSYYNDVLLEELFTIEAHYFNRYFPTIFDRSYSYQAFLMSMVPHMCMRAELSANAHEELARILIQFISECQDEHQNRMTDENFLSFFEGKFNELSIDTVVSSLFFTRIDDEIAFCKSQTQGLVFARQKLIDLGFLNQRGEPFSTMSEEMLLDISIACKKSDCDFSLALAEPLMNVSQLIEVIVPEVDALNLKALNKFYLSLSTFQQTKLIKELILNVILQAGAAYLIYPQLGASSVPTTPLEINRKEASPLKRLSFYRNNSNLQNSSWSQLESLTERVKNSNVI